MQTAEDYFDAANLAQSDEGLEAANALYEKALALQPVFPEAYFNRAGNWEQLEEYAKAIANYKKVLEYWPDDAAAHDYLAGIYLWAEDKRFHNKKLALHHATRACQICEYSEYGAIGTLAAAHAAIGEYAEAVRVQQIANRVLLNHFEADLWISSHEERLREYRKKLIEAQRGNRWWRWLRSLFPGGTNIQI